MAGAPTPERVAEIAAMLSPNPEGLGEPITNRAAWEAFPNPKSILDLANRLLEEPIPEITDEIYLEYDRTGSREANNIPFPERTRRLAYFSLAECIENQGRFLPAIEAEFAALFAEKSWTPSYHDRKLESFNGQPIVDLGAAMRAWTVATIDHLLGDKLQPETRTELRAQIKRRVWNPYRAQIEGNYQGSREWWMRAENNWNAVCHAGVVGSALALLPKQEDRAWFVAAMEMYISNFLHGFTADGYCSEGVGYWTYGMGHYVLLADAVGRATHWQLNLLTPEIVEKALSFPERLEIVPGLYPAFSDNLPNIRPGSWVIPLAARHLAGRQATPVTVNGITMHGHAAMLYETMALAFPDITLSDASAQKAIPLSLRDSFPDAGVIVARTANPSTASGWGIAFKGGHNDEFHNHNDVGSYVLVVNGAPLLADPGSELYTARTFSPRRYESKVLSSYGHSVPVVAGKLQDTGAEARGTLSIVSTSDEVDTYLLDFTKAYSKSVPSLKKLTRKLSFHRLPVPSLEVTDEAEFETPQTFETAIVTFGKVDQTTADAFVVYDGNNAVQVKVEGSGEFSFQQETLNEILPMKRQPQRLGIRLNEPSTNARISYRVESGTLTSPSHPVISKAAGQSLNPQWEKAIRSEAEAHIAETGGKTELVSKMAATGGTGIRMWNADGHELTWEFEAPDAGSYGILVRYARGEPGDALRSLSIDGTVPSILRDGFAFPSTGGWSNDRDDWQEVWLAQNGRPYALDLDAGKHRISLKNLESSSLNLDWIELVPLKK